MDNDKQLIKLAYGLGFSQAIKRAASNDPAAPMKESIGDWWNDMYSKFKSTSVGGAFDNAFVSGPNAQRTRTYTGAAGVGALAGAGLASLTGGNKTLSALIGAGISPLALYLLNKYGRNLIAQD